MKRKLKVGDYATFVRRVQSGFVIARKGLHVRIEKINKKSCSITFRNGETWGGFSLKDLELSEIPVPLQIGEKVDFFFGGNGLDDDAIACLPRKQRSGIIVKVDHFFEKVWLIEVDGLPKYQAVGVPMNCVVDSWLFLNERDVV